MNEGDTIIVGKIGLGISIFLWLLCTWRLGFHSGWKCFGRPARGVDEDDDDAEEEQQQQDGTGPFLQWITRRRAFHGLLWIATLCEVISYADLSGILPFTSDRILAENVAYVLLNITGRTFELLAFCIVTEIWLRTAIEARPRSMHSETANHNFWFHCFIYVFVFFTVLLVLASVLLSVVIFCRYPHAPNREYVLTMPLSMLQTLLEAICWGMHVLMVAISIGMTSKCILVLVPSADSKRRLYLLTKAVGPMIVSCLAYAIRCGWLIAAYFRQSRRDCLAWWISFAWIPTTSVSIVLLYSIRKRDHAAEEMSTIEDSDGGNNVLGSTDDDLRESLLRPQPPEEAFRAFHTFRHGEEDADDLFDLGSPVPRNPPATVAEEEP